MAKKYKFRVKNGKYHEGTKRYAKGDVVHTEHDLRKFNKPNVPEMFELLEGGDDDSDTTATSRSALIEENQRLQRELQDLRAKSVKGSDQPPRTPEGQSSQGDDNSGEDLDDMTLSQLHDLAQKRGVDLEGSTRKADIIQKLKNYGQNG